MCCNYLCYFMAQLTPPFFIDIDPKCFTIVEGKIEEAITDNTTVILATYFLGIPVKYRRLKQWRSDMAKGDI